MRKFYAKFSLVLLASLPLGLAQASTALNEPPKVGLPSRSGILDGSTGERSDLQTIVSRIKPGSVVVLGEMHAEQSVRDQHMEILTALRAQYPAGISVGMEFVDYIDQATLDLFSAGDLSEAEFLAAVKWKGFDFSFYRDQILFPRTELGEKVVGLNLPQFVSRQIGRGGLASLTPEQASLLPPNFTVGRDSYRIRFFEAMGMHPTPSLENYFVAQSAWDDTMAWQAVNFKLNHPEQILVIIVGEFHAQYGGGLQDRIRARMQEFNLNFPILSLSQLVTNEMSDEDIQKAILPSVTEGIRADFIWLSERP